MKTTIKSVMVLLIMMNSLKAKDNIFKDLRMEINIEHHDKLPYLG